MESFIRHNLESHRSSSSFTISKIHSPRNLLTKGLPLPDSNSNEPSLHHSQSQINQNSTFLKAKKEFLPFLNERDGLNRLITPLRKNSKYDPSKLEEPSNPSLYYRASRFKKSRLVFGQAERNKNALGKLLAFQADQEENFLETDRQTRLQKLFPAFKDSKDATVINNSFLGPDDPLRDNSNEKSCLPTQREQRDVSKSPRIASLERKPTQDHSQRMLSRVQTAATSLLKNVAPIKIPNRNMKNLLLSDIRTARPVLSTGNKTSRDDRSLGKVVPSPRFCAPTNSYSKYFVKLDHDMRRLATHSPGIRKSAHENVSNLNNILKKFEVDKDTLIAEDLNILNFPPKTTHRTPRTHFAVESPRTAENFFNKPTAASADLKPLPPQNVMKKIPSRSRFKTRSKGKNSQ